MKWRVVVVFSIVLVFSLYIFLNRNDDRPDEEDVLKKIKEFDVAKDFINSNDNVKESIEFLSKKDIDMLSVKYPVIYSNISSNVFKIYFMSKKENLLILYDYENDKILKDFLVMNVGV